MEQTCFSELSRKMARVYGLDCLNCAEFARQRVRAQHMSAASWNSSVCTHPMATGGSAHALPAETKSSVQGKGRGQKNEWWKCLPSRAGKRLCDTPHSKRFARARMQQLGRYSKNSPEKWPTSRTNLAWTVLHYAEFARKWVRAQHITDASWN